MSVRFSPADQPLTREGVAFGAIIYREDAGAPWVPPPDLPDSLRRAIPKRQAEFAAGRLAARTAGRDCGIETMVLPIGPRRAPVWPDGLVGSIAHSGNMAIAAVGRGARWAGLGIDLEQSGNAARTADFVPRIVTPPEIASLAPSFAAPLATLLVFSAKEAIYKAVAARAGRIGFADARCTGIHGDRLRFATSDLLRPVTGHALEVQFAVADAHIFTLCAVAAG